MRQLVPVPDVGIWRKQIIANVSRRARRRRGLDQLARRQLVRNVSSADLTVGKFARLAEKFARFAKKFAKFTKKLPDLPKNLPDLTVGKYLANFLGLDLTGGKLTKFSQIRFTT